VDHKGIIKLNSAYTDQNYLYFVVEYVDGYKFQDFIVILIKNLKRHHKQSFKKEGWEKNA